MDSPERVSVSNSPSDKQGDFALALGRDLVELLSVKSLAVRVASLPSLVMGSISADQVMPARRVGTHSEIGRGRIWLLRQAW